MSNLRIAELDFDLIKSNLKEFFKSQDAFSDYDFEGSSLSVLLDILAYNTHYNAYLANMSINEMFLDSAVKRSSAVSIAKHLGYTPSSTTGSTAVVNVTVINPFNTPTSLTLERFTPFTTSVNGINYTFITLEPVTIIPINDEYIFNNVTIKEGNKLTFSYTVETPGPDEKYEIPNDNVDLSTLYVTVQKSISDTTTDVYTRVNDITDLSSTSKVFFVEENTLGNYQLYFGDGILGKKLTAGNIIKIDYLVCIGADTNVSNLIDQTFGFSGSIGGSSDVLVDTVSNATGGADKESITSIKYNAIKNNQSRNRAVTASDFSFLIKSGYPVVEAISVWGGEENIPPSYGKVFISLKPYEGYTIDGAARDYIKNIVLKDKLPLTVQPEFVDPDYLYVNLFLNINYNKNLTNITSSDLSVLARNAINTFFTTELQQFSKPFYFSKLLEKLNNINPSVVSVLSEVRVQKRLNPVINSVNSFVGDTVIKFNNRLHPNGFQSTRFFIQQGGLTIPVRLADQHIPISEAPDYNGSGEIYMYNPDNNVRIDTVGTINYATGDVTINSITPVGFPAGVFDIRLTAEVQESSYNVLSARNTIIVLDDSSESNAANRIAGITINVSSI